MDSPFSVVVYAALVKTENPCTEEDELTPLETSAIPTEAIALRG